MEPNQINAFLNELPILEDDQAFCFRCDPQLSCFNLCCADLNLVLSPYDVLMLRKGLEIESRPFLENYTRIAIDPETGFPEVSVAMREDAVKSCPFVTETGCRVYRHRPGACRMYPVGRGARVAETGQIAEQFVLMREEHCLGFQSDIRWTAQTWQADQELEAYNRSNDLYLRMVDAWRKKARPLGREQFGIAILALYRTDAFQRYVQAKGLLDRTWLSQTQKDSILQNEAECLAFAMRWLQSVILSRSADQGRVDLSPDKK
jgi:Fe-S-cluster containining protein